MSVSLGIYPGVVVVKGIPLTEARFGVVKQTDTEVGIPAKLAEALQTHVPHAARLHGALRWHQTPMAGRLGWTSEKYTAALKELVDFLIAEFGEKYPRVREFGSIGESGPDRRLFGAMPPPGMEVND